MIQKILDLFRINNIKRLNTIINRLFWFSFFISIVLFIIVKIQILKIDSIQTQIINKQNELLNTYRKNDSLYKVSKTNDTLAKYISNCNFTINGQSIKTSELLKLFNIQNNEFKQLVDDYNTLLIKSQDCFEDNNQLSDSLRLFNKSLNMIEKAYGIKLNYSTSDNTTFLSIPNNKIDTLIFLYPYIKQNLIFDTLSNKWVLKSQTKIIQEKIIVQSDKTKVKKTKVKKSEILSRRKVFNF